MRSFWNQVAGLRILFAVIAGIGLEIYADYALEAANKGLWLMAASFFISSTALVIINWRRPVLSLLFRFGWLNGLIVTLFLISFGYIHTWFFTEKNYQDHFGRFVRTNSVLTVKIVKPPLEKDKIVQAVAEVNEVKVKNRSMRTTGNILLTFLRDTMNHQPQYGDVIVFHATVEEFMGPQNPDEFSFKLYQSFHNVYHRALLKPGDWQVIAVKQGNLFMSNIYRVREYFLSLIRKYVSDKNDFAVASAIMLGYNDYLNGEVMQAYASSGALHVLSVSGLHVGIMFLMLNFLFLWMDKKGRKFVIAKAFIIVTIIWFYACLTGFSPSVLRSAMMFSMIQFGTVLIRHVNIYNVIATSALVLILFNPFIITEVGFRLSYLAVIGIIYLYPKFYSLWTFKNWLADQAWKIVAVSLAAQLATFPLSLYYFHQFPNLFLLSNLVVIPVSNLLLFTGTALFFVGEIPYLNSFVGYCFQGILHWLDRFIFFIDSIWFALIKGISITMVEMLAIYLLVILWCWLAEERKVKVAMASLLIVFALCSFNAYETWQQSTQKEVVVYSVPGSRALSFIDGRRVNSDFDEKLRTSESSMLFHVRHHWWDCGIKREENAVGKILPFGALYTFGGQRILVVDSNVPTSQPEIKHKLKVDMVLLSHNPKIYIESLQQMFDFDEVVFDSSNKSWRMAYWKRDCDHMKLKYWDVAERGAYIKRIPA